MGLIISGIAACETIDSSGEILKIDGLDISSLERDGVFNWEHESKTASSIVGKILKAKKIFSDQDCVNESQKKYWKALQCPFVWVMGELFDDVGHSEAMNIAAMIRYDMKAKAEGKYGEDVAQLINLSVEGAKLKKEGNMVLRSIARKVSITITPCNKVAQAEAHQADVAKSGTKKNGKLPSDLSIFKSETLALPQADVDMDLKKAGHLQLVKPPQAPKPIGQTRSGKAIGGPKERLNYHKGFTADDHKDAHEAHMKAASAAKDFPTAAAHRTAANFHHQSSQSPSVQRAGTPKAPAAPAAPSTPRANPSTAHVQKEPKYVNIGGKGRGEIKKAMTLGSSAGAPSTLSGGAAVSKEDLQGKIEKLSKAEAIREYNKQVDASMEAWDKVEHFRKFLAEKAPSLTKKEIEAFTRAFAMYRVKKAEKKLKDF